MTYFFFRYKYRQNIAGLIGKEYRNAYVAQKHTFLQNVAHYMKIPALGYAEDFHIRTFAIDANRVISLPALLQLMQEAAMQNVISIKLSVWDLEQHRISWVLMRLQMTVERMPRLGEKIKIVTYPTGFEKFFTYRDYRVYDEAGKVLCVATSTWLLMDTEKRKMTRIPDFIKAYSSRLAENADFALPRASLKPEYRFTRAQMTAHSKVRYFDLDFNQHLSNVGYISRMLEVLPADFLSKHTVKDVDILYRTECRLQDTIIAEAQREDNLTCLHRLRTGDERELMLARTRWQKNKD